jgi:hypothetical protein
MVCVRSTTAAITVAVADTFGYPPAALPTPPPTFPFTVRTTSGHRALHVTAFHVTVIGTCTHQIFTTKSNCCERPSFGTSSGTSDSTTSPCPPWKNRPMRSSASPPVRSPPPPPNRTTPAITTTAVRAAGRPQRREVDSHALERSSRMTPPPEGNERARAMTAAETLLHLPSTPAPQVHTATVVALVLDDEEPAAPLTRRDGAATKSDTQPNPPQRPPRHVSEQKRLPRRDETAPSQPAPPDRPRFLPARQIGVRPCSSQEDESELHRPRRRRLRNGPMRTSESLSR